MWPWNLLLFPSDQCDENPSRTIRREAMSSEQTPKSGAIEDMIGESSLFLIHIVGNLFGLMSIDENMSYPDQLPKIMANEEVIGTLSLFRDYIHWQFLCIYWFPSSNFANSLIIKKIMAVHHFICTPGLGNQIAFQTTILAGVLIYLFHK
jgi:hypothetical protein